MKNPQYRDGDNQMIKTLQSVFRQDGKIAGQAKIVKVPFCE